MTLNHGCLHGIYVDVSDSWHTLTRSIQRNY